jgi:ornithine cyclodeaminase/alanine dehydrogenase-like protein (mu-crystallin family)
MLILSASEVRQALPMDEAISAMKGAYAALSNGQAEVPLRSRLPVPAHGAVSLFMPVYLQDQGGEALAVKIVSLFPGNPGRGLPMIQSAVLVMEAETGRPLALLEGSSLTAIRTGAASGAATDLLARADSHTAAIFGAGVQGQTQLEAVCTVRPIQTAWVYDPEREKAESFVAGLAGKGLVPGDLRIAEDPRQAVAGADVICTATTSKNPVFEDRDLRPGVHLNAVGAYTPEMQEIPIETICRALVVVDSRAACLSEAGDLLQPIRQGRIGEGHIQAELGEIVQGKHPGRTTELQVTLFKSVGVAVQDAAAARLALRRAADLGLGQSVPW